MPTYSVTPKAGTSYLTYKKRLFKTRANAVAWIRDKIGRTGGAYVVRCAAHIKWRGR